MGIAATRISVEPADDANKRRQALRAFLMSRRARLQPADVGLPETRRRRTPGLRREEVAGPAMPLNMRMDVVAANALAVAIFGDLAAAGGYEGNWLWYLFAHHAMIDEWEAQARELTATFHGSMCEHAKDLECHALLHRLLESSETSQRFWNEHDVSQLDQVPPLALAHPTFGPLRFTMRVLAQPGAANPFYFCFLVPTTRRRSQTCSVDCGLRRPR